MMCAFTKLRRQLLWPKKYYPVGDASRAIPARPQQVNGAQPHTLGIFPVRYGKLLVGVIVLAFGGRAQHLARLWRYMAQYRYEMKDYPQARFKIFAAPCSNDRPPSRPLLPVMWRVLLCLSLFTEMSSFAQPAPNPLKDKRWRGGGVGVHSGDYLSYSAMAWQARRSDQIVTGFRLGYSQELITGPKDSCTVSRSRSIEGGIMWGDGYGNDKYYLSAMAGMGLMQRWYCDDDDPGEFIKKSRLTIGVPFQAEAGVSLSGDLRLGIALIANWNFLEPYAGGLISLTWWANDKRN